MINKGSPKYVTLNAPEYKINWDQVKKLVNARTRMIILNSPHNPTGVTFTPEDLMQLQKIVQGKDIIIISDEVYEHIVFGWQAA